MMRFLRISLVLLLLLSLERTVYKLTNGFRVDKIISPLNDRPEWTIENLSNDDKQLAKSLLNQKFHYLGSGVQMYAFLGEDGQTVLKFFKFSRLIPNRWQTLFKSVEDIDHQKVDDCFSSVKLAQTHFKDGCGLIYSHLNREFITDQKVTLINSIGFSSQIDINNIPFVLQKKAVLIADYLKMLKINNDLEGGKRLVQAVEAHVQSRARAGLIDHDIRLHRNLGVIEDRVINIDIGSLSLPRFPFELFFTQGKEIEQIQLKKEIEKIYPLLLSEEISHEIDYAQAN